MAIPHVDERSLELRATAHWLPVFSRVALAACAFAFGFILAGFSEQWAIIQLLILMALTIWFRHELLWCALVGTVAGFGMVMVAPGNAVRAAMLRDAGRVGFPVFEGVVQAAYQTALMVGQTLVFRFYAIAPVFIVGYIAGHGQRVKRRSLAILVVFVGMFALIAVSIAPVLLITGVLSYRSLTTATFIMVCAVGLLGYLVACRKG